MEIAYRIYPLPDGTVYTENNINSIDDVIELFDYCQIMEAMISKNGWAYLIDNFGIDELYNANKSSGWFDCDGIDDFRGCIEDEAEIAYNNGSEHTAITDFFESAHFPAI